MPRTTETVKRTKRASSVDEVAPNGLDEGIKPSEDIPAASTLDPILNLGRSVDAGGALVY